MKKDYLKIVVLLFLSIIFFSCAGVRYRPLPKAPIVRVGILQHLESIKFVPQSDFYLVPKSPGKKMKFKEHGVWTVSVLKSQPAEKVFRILVYQSERIDDVKKYLLEQVSDPTRFEVKKVGDELKVGNKTIAGKKYYQLLVRINFDSRTEAEMFLKTSAQFKSGRIIEEIRTPATGSLQILSPSGKRFAVKNIFRVSGSLVTLKNVRVGTGYHWAHEEDRTFRGDMEFRFDAQGKLTAINVLPLEEYLRGVVPAEMSSTFPIEALKAQAVAARTFFLYHFGKNHRMDPFDVCADVHCQAFAGMSKEDRRSDRAVAETRGLVLTFNGRLCSTPYSAVCGGHTENAENVWETDGEPYLQGIFDIARPVETLRSFDLSTEENAKKWIEMHPKVFCNVKGAKADFANYTKKYFRWEYRISRVELQKIINQKTGKDIGTILDIVPIHRGVSGRLSELLVKGSKQSVFIKKELNIRKTLSPKTLYSACFVVEKIGGNGYDTDEFVFKGAGWGHGVGMCQTGASMMALKGYSFSDILTHYYRGAKIRQLY